MLKKAPFWKKKWSEKVCGITHTRLRPGINKYGDSYVVFLDCTHGFYRSVLIEWVKNCPNTIPTCPICRNKFNQNSI